MFNLNLDKKDWLLILLFALLCISQCTIVNLMQTQIDRITSDICLITNEMFGETSDSKEEAPRKR